MKTRLSYDKGYISLIVDHQGDLSKDRAVLAAMTLFDGTGCWSIVDIRLDPDGYAHPWSGSLIGEDFQSSIVPESIQDAAYIKSRLKEYEEREDGRIVWCTYRDIVRGQTGVKGYIPAGRHDFHAPVYHSRSDGIAYLKDAKQFWDVYEGEIEKAKINNPFRQPGMTGLRSELMCRKAFWENGLDMPDDFPLF